MPQQRFVCKVPEPDIRIAALCGGLTLHHDLGLKTFKVAKDRGDCGHTSVALKAEEAVFAHHISVDQDLVPRLRVTDIIDRDIVVLAPEKRHLGEGCALPKHVESRGLSLTLGDNPMLDTEIFT